jgi:hypothetical protein
MLRKKKILVWLIVLLVAFPILITAQIKPLPQLKISANHRYFMTADGKPFFWLGDTGWLLFVKLKREEAVRYLFDRKEKGFNVIQVMVLHDVNLGVNVYGDSALINHDASKLKTTPGNTYEDKEQYDFWDHVDFVIEEAERLGLYIALVPVWGGNVKGGLVNQQQGKVLATFLANRYKNRSNIIWLNGGDVKGSDGLKVWQTIGKTIRSIDKNHLITFHPRGRMSSSKWFHKEAWLDFNMFQSGHRSYAQDTSTNEPLHYGEDNWRYVQADYALKPVKPTMDGEPSYEDIPYGLHDGNEPYWQDFEIRRYAYWSLFAGGCGFTYGHNSVMQFYTPGDSGISFFPKVKWQDGLKAPGAGQMKYAKELLLSRPYFERIPDQSLIVKNGIKYNRVIATRGKNYALFYAYNAKPFTVNIGKIMGKKVTAHWYDPRTGDVLKIGSFNNAGTQEFTPPGTQRDGNDWVLTLDTEK